MSVALKQVKVDGYKNLIECKADLNDLNVLVGPNNSGKSNFLEIFSFVSTLLVGSDSTRKIIFESARTPRGESSICHLEEHICKPVAFSFILQKAINDIDVEIEYSMSIKCKDYLSEINGKNEDYLGFICEKLSYKEKNKPGKPIILLNRDKTKLQLRSAKGNLSNHKIDAYAPALNTVRVFLADNNKLNVSLFESSIALLELFEIAIISASPNEIRANIGKGSPVTFDNNSKTTSFDIIPVIEEIDSNKGLFTQFRNTVCSILDIEDIKFTSFKIPDKYKSKDSPEYIKWLSLKQHGQDYSDVVNYSDGTLMVIALLAILFSPSRKSKLICIEEPENCLHPKALKTLMTFLKAKSIDNQLLITTHSPSLLNQIDPTNVIVARIHEDGGTRFERINNVKELNKVLRKGYISFGDLLEVEFREDDEVIF